MQICTVFVLQVYSGKEKEAVSDMLPYLRLGYVSDPSEMQSVISSEGPVCPVSRLFFRLQAGTITLFVAMQGSLYSSNWSTRELNFTFGEHYIILKGRKKLM